ncbi:O-antigen ligase family protein, partial [Patescibacteria group bacterium]|nr:O-antigen ligase family protein [Patescibacteria group bacterium]
LFIILSTIFLTWYRLEYGFLVLIFEFFSGHGGLLFELGGISLRTALFLIIILTWLFKKVRGLNRQNLRLPNSPLLIFFLLLLFLVLFGALQGLNNHQPLLAIKDLINYSYLLLVFPLVEVLKKLSFQKNVFKFSLAAVIGISILTIIIFIFFVTNLVEVHDPFYWWWREVAIGKATYTGNNFYRIVTPAHLLILPLLLIFLSFLASVKLKINQLARKKIIWLAVLASLAILINFSRIYFLGFLVGLVVLAYGLPWRRWLIFSLVVIIILVLEFGAIYTLVSGGEGFYGLQFLKQRMRSVVSPEEELSSLTRIVILPRLIEQIREQPIFGQGLGATITYPDPITNEQKTTFHLDWGYLEIWLELGLLALMIYLTILGLIFYQGWKKIKSLGSDLWQQRLTIGLLAGLASLAVATITGPFLFHPLGIFYLTFTAAFVLNQPTYDS